MMVCLNGVHVEAQGLLSITSAVTLAVAFYYASVGGRPLHSSTLILKTDKVRALCVCYCDFSPPSLALHHSLCLTFSFLQDRSVSACMYFKTAQDETQVHGPCFLLYLREP